MAESETPDAGPESPDSTQHNSLTIPEQTLPDILYLMPVTTRPFMPAQIQPMMADAEHGPNLLEAPKSQGILEFAESGIILRVKFKCKPREQFVLRRVLNERMMAEFAKAGVRFAFPTVMVERGEESEGDEQAAAQSVLTAARLPAKLT